MLGYGSLSIDAFASMSSTGRDAQPDADRDERRDERESECGLSLHGVCMVLRRLATDLSTSYVYNLTLGSRDDEPSWGHPLDPRIALAVLDSRRR